MTAVRVGDRVRLTGRVTGIHANGGYVRLDGDERSISLPALAAAEVLPPEPPDTSRITAVAGADGVVWVQKPSGEWFGCTDPGPLVDDVTAVIRVAGPLRGGLLRDGSPVPDELLAEINKGAQR